MILLRFRLTKLSLPVLLSGPLLLSFCFSLAGCSRGSDRADAANNSAQITEVTVATAEERGVERSAEVVGSLLADEEVQISNDTAGFLAAVHVDLGSRVQRGQVLAELDKRDFELRVLQARAMLAQARARLGLEKDQDSISPEETALVRQAKANLDDARSKYDSARKLVETGDIPQQRYIELEKTLRAREAAHEAAVEEVRAQLAQIQARKAELGLAEKQLQDVTIRAPLTGSVTAKLISAGQFIKEKTPLLVLVKDDVLRLRAQVPESATAAVRSGLEVRFLTDAYPGRTFTARISRVGQALDPQARTLVAEAIVPNPERLLKPGMFARIAVVVEKSSPAVMVPRTALYEFAGLTKIFVVNDDHVKEMRIQPGVSADDWVEIRGDAIRPGMQVATSNLDRLEEGGTVRIKR